MYFDCLSLNNYFIPYNMIMRLPCLNDLNICHGTQSHQFNSWVTTKIVS